MNEITRIGLPNIVSQGDALARSRGTMSGGELVLQQLGAQAAHRDAVQRAEHVQPTAKVEAMAKRERERRGQDEDGQRDEDERRDEPDDDGHLIDLMA